MSIMLCPNAEELKAYSLGRLGEPQSDQLATHLSGCKSCQTELETVVDDSLIVDLRLGDRQPRWEAEEACEVGLLRSLGVLGKQPESEIPTQIGEYKIVRLLGRGGMGAVYLARHTRLDREVALKVLADHRLANQHARQRFEAEMHAIGRLSHPGIVTAYDARDIESTAVIVTEFIDGMDLEELVRRVGPLAVADACAIARRVADALQYTSDAGYVHRDVKPSNIMLSRSGEVKLLDLGLARPEASDSQMTGTGQAMGTADYIAPEQVTDGKNVDIRADIYSLGCTLFKLLTGEVLFNGDQYTTAFAKMTAHVSSEPRKLNSLRSDAPTNVVKQVSAMLAKSPADRPPAPADISKSLAGLAQKADLEALIQVAEASKDAEAAEPELTDELDGSSPSSLLHCRAPVWVLVFTGMAALFLGVLLGVIITIKYPDGTVVTMNAPNGSEVLIEERRSETRKTVAPLSPNELMPKTDELTRRLAESPLAFAAFVDTSEIPEYERGAAFQWLLAQFDATCPAALRVTPFGTYISLAGNLRVERGSAKGGLAHIKDKRFVLVESTPESQLAWEDLAGHLVVTDNDRQVKLTFDSEVAGRLGEFLKMHVNRDIAVISFGSVVAITQREVRLKQLAIDKNLFEGDDLQMLIDHVGGVKDSVIPSTYNAPPESERLDD